MIEFQPWGKTPRLFKDMVVTEKIDGTNAAIIIVPTNELVGPAVTGFADSYPYAQMYAKDGVTAFVKHDDVGYAVAAQSRRRIITPNTPGSSTDNAGFAAWVAEHAAELVDLLGPGRHYGEWWGLGIQRGYNQEAKHFSLFNIHRYADLTRTFDDGTTLGVVPTLRKGPFSLESVSEVLEKLSDEGSAAAPGYMRPEGVVVFHTGGRGDTFKAFVNDEEKAQEVRDR